MNKKLGILRRAHAAVKHFRKEKRGLFYAAVAVLIVLAVLAAALIVLMLLNPLEDLWTCSGMGRHVDLT